MKVIHLIDSGGYFGAERVLVTLALEQRSHGYDLSIVSGGDLGEGEKPFEAECKKVGLNLTIWRGNPFRNLYGLVKKHPQAIFHSHGYKFNILLALLRSFFRASIFVATVHGYTSAPRFSKLFFYYQFNKLALKFLAGSVFVSHKAALDSNKKINNNNLVIYNGIADTDSGTDIIDDSQFSAAEYIIGVGRLSAEKAFDDLIRSFLEVSENHKSLQLLIVGDGKEMSNLRQLAKGHERIHFIGHKENPLFLIAKARLLVISSISEGLPIVLLEAMRAGVDVVSSRVGAISDVIDDGVTGLLYDAGNVSQLTSTINNALSNEKGTFGALARIKFSRDFTSEKMFWRYHAWYESLLR